MTTLLPGRNVLMRNTASKKPLISLLCCAEHGKSLKLVDPENDQFQHKETDINLISYMLLMENDQNKKIQVVGDVPDVFVLLVY